MRILIACEMSGIVRREFKKAGHSVLSVDLQPSEDNSPDHIVGDVRAYLTDEWDLIVAFPPCTYLSKAGLHWNHRRPERWTKTWAAVDFVKQIYDAPVPFVAIENPPGFLNSHWMKPNQTIQPFQFGDEKRKPISLWLRGLPPLFPTNIVGQGEFYIGGDGQRIAKWSSCPGKWSKAKKRRHRSRFFPGVAAAMANQWSRLYSQTVLF